MSEKREKPKTKNRRFRGAISWKAPAWAWRFWARFRLLRKKSISKRRSRKKGTPVQFMLNGAPRKITVQDHWSLNEVLREHLNLTGTKLGCDRRANAARARF